MGAAASRLPRALWVPRRQRGCCQLWGQPGGTARPTGVYSDRNHAGAPGPGERARSAERGGAARMGSVGFGDIHRAVVRARAWFTGTVRFSFKHPKGAWP